MGAASGAFMDSVNHMNDNNNNRTTRRNTPSSNSRAFPSSLRDSFEVPIFNNNNHNNNHNNNYNNNHNNNHNNFHNNFHDNNSGNNNDGNNFHRGPTAYSTTTSSSSNNGRPQRSSYTVRTTTNNGRTTTVRTTTNDGQTTTSSFENDDNDGVNGNGNRASRNFPNGGNNNFHRSSTTTRTTTNNNGGPTTTTFGNMGSGDFNNGGGTTFFDGGFNNGGGTARNNNRNFPDNGDTMRFMLNNILGGGVTEMNLGGRMGGAGMDDYEQLLRTFGTGTENMGANAQTISTFPTSIITNVEKELPENARTCCICLEDFVVGDKRKTLPCLHGFHEQCIDRALQNRGCCPICNVSITTET